MEALNTDDRRAAAMHSNASPDWGTPPIVRRFCATFLRPAAIGDAIDLDYASSAYWQRHWPDGMRPTAYLNGSKGRDVLVEADRREAIKSKTCGAGFENAPGLDGGRMIQRCWEVFELDQRSGWLDSGAWVGFSLEQFASLQGVGERNPLSSDGTVTTVVSSRRVRYELHPEALIALLLKKQAKRDKGSPQWQDEARQIAKLRARDNDAPVPGLAPTHASYITLLPSRNKATRRRQFDAMHQFLKSQKDQPKSPFQCVEIIGATS